MILLEVAEEAWTIMKSKQTAGQKMRALSTCIQNKNGLGETWAKMLSVCIDLAYPKELLLESQCDVGTGAAPPLKVLAPKGNYKDNQEKLKALMNEVNAAKSPLLSNSGLPCAGRRAG